MPCIANLSIKIEPASLILGLIYPFLSSHLSDFFIYKLMPSCNCEVSLICGFRVAQYIAKPFWSNMCVCC